MVCAFGEGVNAERGLGRSSVFGFAKKEIKKYIQAFSLLSIITRCNINVLIFVEKPIFLPSCFLSTVGTCVVIFQRHAMSNYYIKILRGYAFHI